MTRVFIAHQKSDRVEAKKISDYLRSVNIEVYFDEFDKELLSALQENNPKKVVNAIKKGVKKCSHMLCLISPNTLYSKWVPFEVGYGYDRTVLATLTLKGIENKEIPDYIKAAPIIRDIYDINKLVKSLGNKYLFESKNYSNYQSSLHPLNNVMDKIIT